MWVDMYIVAPQLQILFKKCINIFEKYLVDDKVKKNEKFNGIISHGALEIWRKGVTNVEILGSWRPRHL